MPRRRPRLLALADRDLVRIIAAILATAGAIAGWRETRGIVLLLVAGVLLMLSFAVPSRREYLHFDVDPETGELFESWSPEDSFTTDDRSEAAMRANDEPTPRKRFLEALRTLEDAGVSLPTPPEELELMSDEDLAQYAAGIKLALDQHGPGSQN